MPMISEETFFFAIDRGGTFTDVYARAVSKSDASNQREFVHKLLSVDPENYPDAPREGIRRILEEATGRPHPKNEPLDTSRIAQIRMGTTVATNALLERKGEPFVLVTTRGFKDLLRIGNQSRPKIFDLAVEMPEVLFDSVIEIDERVTLIGYTTGKSGAENRSKNVTVENDGVNIVKGVTGEYVQILKRPDLEKVRGDFQKILGRGIKSVAICLMHSFTFRDHEREIGKLARDMGFEQVTESSEIMPMIKVVARGMSACVDAYLTPCIKSYIQGFASGFDEHLHDRVAVEFMQSDGGLTSVTEFSGSKAILSGPAGGVVGYALTSYDQETAVPVIGFDMGGTSTDVSRYHGRYEHVFETSTAGITIQAPQLDINTVAAGGGSRLFFQSGMFVVGPESAGAHPGPVCYRKGGPLAVTDANLLLGRIVPEHFPHIFGPTEDQPLDLEVTKSAFGKLANEINGYLSTSMPPKTMSTDEIAFGFIKVANESMCRAIRTLTEAKGHDTSKHILSSFGGAGGQHACAIAQTLGIRKIFIHRHSSILSAYGLSLADVVHEVQEPSAVVLGDKSLPLLKERIEVLLEKCAAQLETQGFKQNCITHEVYLNLRYHGTDCALMTLKPEIGGNYHEWDFAAAFSENYRQEYGFHFPDRQIIVDDIRIRGIGRTFSLLGAENLQTLRPAFPSESDLKLSPDGTCAYGSKCVGITSTYFEGGRRNTPVYLLKDLEANQKIMGPAMILDENTTVVVAPFCVGLITDSKDIGILVGTGQRPKIDTALDPIQLAIFSHRFMSIAEQMGRVLERTAISTNIKERLDFSCALFGPDGGLVSNAPHIPIHLGSMQEAVKFQLKHREGDLRDGDVLLSNHPRAGGTHLPDLTAITPVFKDGKVVFFVASRGHHADIGGISPGSMPPHSKEIYQEGAAIKSFKLLDGGVFNEKGITEILMSPARHPGCSGTRNLSDNLSDLKAQVAANHKGINLVKSLMEEYGLEVVQAYMSHIRENAEVAVRELFMSLVRAKENTDRTLVLSATDSMDDGTLIQLRITIDGRDGSAVFDFEGTGHEVYGNTNAPPAVTYSAIIYCLRCLVGREIPLNQGCLNPVTVLIPSGSILSPSEGAAVVGGNVLTSQRLCDVVLKAFGACAASQGDMNNLTFGDEEFGYYETIGGGAGAGPTWHGRSGVHTHMTNTRITDAEILERRYPILLHEFGLRPGSGGTGTYRGGDGVIREMEFTKRLRVSILSERRSFRPYGMKGGGEGKAGENLWKKRDGRIVNLLAKNSVDVEEGDRLRISTPGGGGYGKA